MSPAASQRFFLAAMIFLIVLSTPAWAVKRVDFSLPTATASISGEVLTDGSGGGVVEALQNIPVYAVNPTTQGIEGSAITDAQGQYSISLRGGATYKVIAAGGFAFTPQNGFGSYVYEYYPGVFDASAAQSVAVPATGTAGGIDFALGNGLTISGKVETQLPAQQAQPLGFSSVVAVPANVSDQDFVNAPWAITAYFGSTDASGNYTISGLPPFSYYVYTASFGVFANEIYPGAYEPDQAIPIDLSSQTNAASIDFLLEVGGSLSGRVTGSDTGDGIEDTSVSFIRKAALNASSDNIFSYLSFGALTTTTDSNGDYQISGVAPGTYVGMFNFDRSDDDKYAPQYLGGNSYSTSATDVTVSVGQTISALDVSALIGGTIKGTVKREDNGLPLEKFGVAVEIADAFVDRALVGLLGVKETETDVLGNFEIIGLPQRPFVVAAYAENPLFSDAPEINQYFAPEFYNNANYADNADTVTPSPGGSPVDIAFELAIGDVVEGFVRDDGNNALEGATVGHVYTDTPNVPNFEPWLLDSRVSEFSFVQTAADGSYRIAGLRPGLGILESFAPDFLTQYANDKDDISAADEPQFVSDGFPTGSMSGRIVDASTNQPLSQIPILVYRDTGTIVGESVTNAQGEWMISGLFPDTYRVGANISLSLLGESDPDNVLLIPDPMTDQAYSSLFWVNANDFLSASGITVEEGENETGVNFALMDSTGGSGDFTAIGIILDILLFSE